jgi:hypothetical protein
VEHFEGFFPGFEAGKWHLEGIRLSVFALLEVVLDAFDCKLPHVFGRFDFW